MITPGLLRRAFLRAAQWRLLVVQLGLLAIASYVAAQPWSAFFQAQLGHLVHGNDLAAALGARGVVELAQQAGGMDPLHAETGFAGGVLLTLLFGPLFAAAVLAVSTSEEALHSRQLLEGAGRYFGRMLRMLFASAIPLSLAIALAAMAFKWSSKAAEKATLESAATHAGRIAIAIAAVAYLLAAVWIDAGRAWFVAQPARRSAFFAVFAGGWLVLRRPFRSLLIGVATLLVGTGLAAAAMIARQRIIEGSTGKMVLALLVAQLGLLFLAWGRAARLVAFVELAHADLLARAQPAGTFEMAPPKTSPPPIASETGPATPAAHIDAAPAASALAPPALEPSRAAAPAAPAADGPPLAAAAATSTTDASAPDASVPVASVRDVSGPDASVPVASVTDAVVPAVMEQVASGQGSGSGA